MSRTELCVIAAGCILVLGFADGGRGYMLYYHLADTVGYNMRDLNELSAALGVRIGKYVVLRGEYAFRDIDLVRGVSPDIHAAAGDDHWFAFDVGVAF